VSIDCGAIPREVLEAELFGVTKQYPGFHNPEPLVGRLDAANGGVLLLDEIGNMDLGLQVKLLRVLEEKEFRPIGADQPRSLEAQVIASTNSNLEKAVADGRFRKDLFYRLNEIPIALPPLRERMEDLPLLVAHFLGLHNRRTGEERKLTPDAMEKLNHHTWPGNVRELKKRLERAFCLGEGRFITPHDIDLRGTAPQPSPHHADLAVALSALIDKMPSLRDAEQEFRTIYVEEVIRRMDGDKQRIAVHLGIDLRTLRRILSDKS
jgi:transcriptional regulator with PAS, ATPase and Fis domain